MRRLVMPVYRGECVDGPRPCPHIRCRYHLILDQNAACGVPVLDELSESCALDVADQGEHSLEEIGGILGLTRERVRQIEEKAQNKLRRVLIRLEGGIRPLQSPGRVAGHWSGESVSTRQSGGKKRRSKAKRRTGTPQEFIVRVDGVEIGRFGSRAAARKALEVWQSENAEELADQCDSG